MSQKAIQMDSFFVLGEYMIAQLKDILQIIIAGISITVSMYALYKFLNGPHTTIEKRVSDLEKDVGDIKQSLKEGNDKFRKQEKQSSMFIAVMLSFVDFEIAYCHNTGYKDNEDLLKAKRILQNYLAGQEGYEHEED